MFQVYRLLRQGLLGSIAIVTMSGAFGLVGGAQAEPAPGEGYWFSEHQESIIKVHPCNDTGPAYCGTLVWFKDPLEPDGSPKIDKLNLDPALKGKPMIGVNVFYNMKLDDGHLKGKAYNPESGKTGYEMTFKVRTEKEADDTADVRGCLMGFLCQTTVFTRAKEVPGGDPTMIADASVKKPHRSAKKDAAKK